jgi:hypothetical protein
MDDDDLLLIDEVAKITRRSESTLRWLRHRGEGPPAHRAGRRLYYRRGAVRRWLAELEQRDTDPRAAVLPASARQGPDHSPRRIDAAAPRSSCDGA